MSARAMWLVVLVLAVAAAVTFYLNNRSWERDNPGVVDLQTAWNQVQDYPREPRGWAALGDAQAAIDQTSAAESSYRMAIRLGSREPGLLGRLGFLLYGQGRDGEALVLLAEAQEGGAELPMLASTVADLQQRFEQQQPEIEAPLHEEETRGENAHESCSIPLRRTHPQRGTFLVDLHVQGEPTTLVVDTGASLTAVSHELIERLGLTVNEERTINAITATGPAVFPTAEVESLTLAGRRLERLTVAVCNACGGSHAEGLLGLDVQAALNVDIDIQRGHLALLDCTVDLEE